MDGMYTVTEIPGLVLRKPLVFFISNTDQGIIFLNSDLGIALCADSVDGGKAEVAKAVKALRDSVLSGQTKSGALAARLATVFDPTASGLRNSGE